MELKRNTHYHNLLEIPTNRQKILRCEIDFSPIENLAKFSFIQKIPREKTALTSRQIDQKYNGPAKFDVFHFELDFGETK